jgi:hypothetical protein
MRGAFNSTGLRRGAAVKSRNKAHRAKGKKSLNGKVFGAASESLF